MAVSRSALSALLLVCLSVASVSPLSAAPPDKASLDFFEKNIRPVLVQKCYECHSADSKKVKGGLLLDTRDGLLKGGESGAAIVPGDVDGSILIEALRHEGLEMPPSGKLPDNVIANFEKWVKMGAPDPRDGKAVAVKKEINFEEARQFWAFQPPKKSPLPKVSNKNKSWPKTDLDRFILAGLEAKGLVPVGDADRYTLLRRVTFDLTGLPPTPEAIEQFVNDKSPDALAKVVDRLLASPQFGERWGRHWLDVVRYAESTGKERNVPYHYAWRYRNWVIDAVNADKPYDRFITEQIAGDLLPAANDEERNANLVATGFLTLGPKGLNERNAEQYTMDVVDEQLDVTCRAILGVTVACARCHDHKFDPIPSTDYYALAGIFRSTAIHPGVTRGSRNTSEKDLLAMAATGKQEEPKAEPVNPNAEEIKKIEAQIAELQAQIREGAKAAKGEASKPDKKAANKRDKQLQQARQQINRLQNRLAQLAVAPTSAKGDLAMAASEGRPANCRICIRGEVNDLGPEVPRGFVTVLKTGHEPTIDPSKSGRLELAQWLTSRDNPTTARVMVNRIWHHLFGVGLVETTDNFGQLGERPTHPELLDNLAIQFMDGGWSVKQTIRSIVLSRTYQLSSEHSDANYAVDPGNRLLWRASRRRLDAESLRDAVLAASGQLDLARPEASATLELGGGEIGRGLNLRPVLAERKYRSVYLPILRGVVPEMLTVFDVADPNNVVGQREVTTVATQALYMMNSPFVMERASEAAKRILSQSDMDEAARADLAYRLALSRPASSAERERAIEFVREFQQTLAGSESQSAQEQAWGTLCQTLFASAEFRYVY